MAMIDKGQEELRLTAELARARQAGAPATLTLHEWLSIINHFEWHLTLI